MATIGYKQLFLELVRTNRELHERREQLTKELKEVNEKITTTRVKISLLFDDVEAKFPDKFASMCIGKGMASVKFTQGDDIVTITRDCTAPGELKLFIEEEKTTNI